jgi:hypothetical protein
MAFPYVTLTKSITCSTTAFAANQVMGDGVQSVYPVPNNGFIQGITIDLKSTNANQVDLVIFASSMPNTTFTDHSSIAISSADAWMMESYIPVTNWAYMGTSATLGSATSLSVPFYSSDQHLYYALVARGAITLNTTNDIMVGIAIAS